MTTHTKACLCASVLLFSVANALTVLSLVSMGTVNGIIVGVLAIVVGICAVVVAVVGMGREEGEKNSRLLVKEDLNADKWRD